MASSGVMETTTPEAGSRTPSAVPEEFAATAEASPPYWAADPNAVDEHGTIVVVVITIAGVGVTATIRVVPTAVGIAHGASRRSVVIAGVTVIARPGVTVITGIAQTDSDGYARLSRSGGRNGRQDCAGTQCDFCQLSHVEPRTQLLPHITNKTSVN